ncbi:hypothetical protein [Halobellus captivus]|uniref:hypothetical protein n=1 Tax=Halobellus captivus TaxID=2592614 RepID=UPI0011A67674|nr:hypothetical protein [Halobellus captivus]
MVGAGHSETTSLRPSVRSNQLTLLDGIGAIVLTGVLLRSHGVWGLLVGIGVLGAATASSGPAAFLLAQLGIVSLVSVAESWTLAATQLAAGLLLASAAYGPTPTRAQLGRFTAAYVAALGLVWGLQANLRWLWQSALLVVALAAGVAYVLHRYERVNLGLVTTPDGSTEVDR